MAKPPGQKPTKSEREAFECRPKFTRRGGAKRRRVSTDGVSGAVHQGVSPEGMAPALSTDR